MMAGGGMQRQEDLSGTAGKASRSVALWAFCRKEASLRHWRRMKAPRWIAAQKSNHLICQRPASKLHKKGRAVAERPKEFSSRWRHQSTPLAVAIKPPRSGVGRSRLARRRPDQRQRARQTGSGPFFAARWVQGGYRVS